MIIKAIHIDGFGVFNNFSLNKLDKGVNILLGNNEAGKSTLLSFLRYTLFGYPDPRKKANQYPPLNGGQHGGRIQAILNSGKEATFERYSGSRKGKINLSYNGQETQNQSQWHQLLSNASEDLYNNVYAFSLDELVRLDSLAKSGVEDKIFSVNLGLGNISIGDVENNIRKKIEDLYKQRGKNQLVPQILNEIKEKRNKVRSIQENLPQYQTLKHEIRQLEEEIHELGNHIKSLNEEKSKLENYLKCYEYFITITKAEQAMKTLPGLKDFPEKGVEKLEKLEEKEQEFLGSIEELNNGTTEEKGIGELKEAIEAVTFNSQIPEEEDKVDYLRKNLEKYRQTIAIKQDEEQQIKNHEQTIKTDIAGISGSWSERNITGFTDFAVHRDKIEAFRNEFDRLTEEKRDLDARIKAIKERESSFNIKAIASVLSAILAVGAIPAIISGSYILGGALIVIALILFFGKKHLVKEGGYELLQRRVNELNEEEQKLKQKYTQYLEDQLNLPVSLSTQATLEALKRIEQISKEINERDTLKDKIESQIVPFIRRFEDTARTLQDKLNKEIKEDNIEMIVAQAIEEFDYARDQLQKKRNLEEELARKEKALQNARSKLEQNRGNINELLNSIEAADREEFRKKYQENEEVKKQIERKNTAVEAIENIVGHNKVNEVIDYLKNHDKQTIETRVGELTDKIDSEEKEWKEKNNALGGKKNEIRRLEGESELAEALTQLETARQKLKEAYKQWITGTIALNTLNEVKSKYEQEKQPAVIQNSSHYFSKITRGSYEKIRVSLDNKDVRVYDHRDASKKIEELSRGTREQLLISLRLGFIEEYEKQAEPLPLIVDEVMVNFDPYRAAQTAELLQEFGQTRQILFFTCHPDTVEYFDRPSIQFRKIRE